MKLAALRALTDEDLIKEHDKHSDFAFTQEHYRTELARKDQDRQTEAMLLCNQNMLKYTHRMFWFTVVVTVATLLNLVAVVIPLFK